MKIENLLAIIENAPGRLSMMTRITVFNEMAIRRTQNPKTTQKPQNAKRIKIIQIPHHGNRAVNVIKW